MKSIQGCVAQKPHGITRLLGAALVGLVVLGSIGMAGSAEAGNRDQRKARQALKAGQIVPLRKMLGVVEAEYEGDVLEVELDDERVDGVRIWVYEIKLLTPQGNVLKMDIDAKTMKILHVKGRGAAAARKK